MDNTENIKKQVDLSFWKIRDLYGLNETEWAQVVKMGQKLALFKRAK
jgi:hypothetical protein